MAKKRGDGDREEPTLELPSLFGRGRKRRGERPAEPVGESVDAEPALAEPERPEPAAQEPVPPLPERPPVEQPQPAARPVAAEAQDVPEPEPEPVAAAEAAPRPRRRATPRIPTSVAAVVTGLVVGLLGAVLTYASLRGCEMLKGTESCGGPGLGLLVVILVLMMVVGAVVLRLLGVSEPRGTSFLAVGLMCVVVLVTLMEDLFSAWMFVAMPLICAASYVLAHWVTTQFVETVDDRPHVDVR